VTTRTEQACQVCGVIFTPYRSRCVTCSKTCYRKLPQVAHANNERKKRPEVRDRRNARRRETYGPHDATKNREHNLRKNYGLTVAEYEQMFDRQNGVCAICGEPPAQEGWKTVTRLHVDHDHNTGQVRSLLCNNCNRALGYFQDNRELLRRATEYLDRWKQS
jgi:hypothetical protein